MKCCLCRKEIEVKGTWKLGNNAQPLKKGRCCDYCDATKVIPERIRRYVSWHKLPTSKRQSLINRAKDLVR